MHTRLKPLAALLPLLFVSDLHAQQALDPVVVTATRQETRVSEVLADVTVIEREEIERNVGGSVVDLLSRQPGIQIATSGGGTPGSMANIFMRGANPGQTKVLVDGIPIASALDQKGTNALVNLPLSNVERIEILRGPASVLYGADAIGGVIQIFTRKGIPGLKVDAFSGVGSWGAFQANAGVSGGDEYWRFRVEGGRDSARGFSTQRDGTNQDADKDGYYNNHAAAALSFLPAKGHELGLTYRHNDGLTHYDSGNVPANSTVDNRNSFNTEQWQIFSKNQITDIWLSKLQYGETKEKQRNHYTDSWYRPTFEGIGTAKTKTSLLGWQNDIKLPLGKALIGVEQQEQKGYSEDQSSFPLPYPSQNMTNRAAYASWIANWEKHRWQIGGRHDDHSQFGGKSTGAIAYGYQISDQWRAKASYGTAFRAPTINELYLPLFGNPSLKPEEARNREMGLVWESAKQSASATYYYNRVKNLIAADPSDWKNYNVGRAKLEGVTLAYSGQFNDWTVRATYDWLNAKDEDTGLQLQRRARNSAVFGVDKTWGSLLTGIELMSFSKRYSFKDEKGEMGGYALVNLSARYAFNKNLSLEGRLNNVFDRKYELSKADYSNYTSLNTYNTPGRNIFVGIRYTPQ